ncbi:GNAT family N-acetyltransferase [Spongisporangium articulatum]|uniref:GNAT family N-acetyltransferase n=1 Tax=Spongisporangium articulatum TaxID=3362603 RepID=A0ABW8AMS1_9ACTN
MDGSRLSEGIEALLADGRVTRIRPVRPGDEPALARLHEAASDASLRTRFFTLGRSGARRYAEHLARSSDHLALVAVTDDEIIGVGSAELPREVGDEKPTGPTTAEVALLVAEPWQGHGVGTLLLEHLAAAGRAAGITAFTADLLSDNAAMLDVFRGVGLDLHDAGTTAGVRSLTVNLGRTELSDAFLREREQIAEQLSMASVLAPDSVAVVGVGRHGHGVGKAVLANLVDGGFPGPVAAVNQHLSRGSTLDGVPVFRSLSEIPWPLDLVVVAVPASQAAAVLEDAGRAGAGAAVVLSSGFERSAARGLATLAHRYGMRLVGPNCLGVLNSDPDVRLNATFDSLPLTPEVASGVALASQSGGLGIAVLDAAARRHLPVAAFVSLGDKVDVSGNDLLLAWRHDPHVRVVGLYLESIGNPRRFRRIAAQTAAATPVVALRSGRTAAGARATASHTAAVARPDAVAAALLRDSGVIAADTSEQLLDVLHLLTRQPLPAGTRVAVLGNAGGPGALAADAVVRAGGTVPVLDDRTGAELHRAVPDAPAVDNPLDLGAGADADGYRHALRAVYASGQVDAVLAVHATVRTRPAGGVVAAVEAEAARPGALPTAAVLIGSPAPVDSCVPWFEFPEGAALALVRAGDAGRWRARDHAPLSDVPDDGRPGLDTAGLRRWVTTCARNDEGRVAAGDALGLLDLIGVPHARTDVVTGPVEAARLARRWAVPVVVKSGTGGPGHRTGAGGVVLDVPDPDAAAAACREVMAATGCTDVLVQERRAGGFELLVGVSAPAGGLPVVVVGAGGVQESLLADHAMRSLPLERGTAARMLAELRLAPVFSGFRGTPPLDRAAVVSVLERISRLADVVPEICELDLNPLIVTPAGVVAVDVKVRLLTPGQHRTPDSVVDVWSRALDQPT